MFDTVVFNDAGLVPVITQDASTKEVLMLAWADLAALEASIATGNATYYSRSRACQWVKGEISGHTQRVLSVNTDCDGDAVLYIVDQCGPACHTGSYSCFLVGESAKPGPSETTDKPHRRSDERV